MRAPNACTASRSRTSETAPRFPDVVDDFLAFIEGAELIIHNAEFDVGFIEHELRLMQHPQPKIHQHATVLDTLLMARAKHPGQRNSLDALCKRYEVDATRRDLHGALIDSELLANVYLAMTGGQTAMLLDDEPADAPNPPTRFRRAGTSTAGAGKTVHHDLPVVEPTLRRARRPRGTAREKFAIPVRVFGILSSISR